MQVSTGAERLQVFNVSSETFFHGNTWRSLEPWWYIRCHQSQVTSCQQRDSLRTVSHKDGCLRILNKPLWHIQRRASNERTMGEVTDRQQRRRLSSVGRAGVSQQRLLKRGNVTKPRSHEVTKSRRRRRKEHQLSWHNGERGSHIWTMCHCWLDNEARGRKKCSFCGKLSVESKCGASFMSWSPKLWKEETVRLIGSLDQWVLSVFIWRTCWCSRTTLEQSEPCLHYPWCNSTSDDFHKWQFGFIIWYVVWFLICNII